MKHRRPILRVLSAIMSNLAAGFYLSLIAIKDPLTLTANLLFGIVSMLAAIKIEQLLDNYD